MIMDILFYNVQRPLSLLKQAIKQKGYTSEVKVFFKYCPPYQKSMVCTFSLIVRWKGNAKTIGEVCP